MAVWRGAAAGEEEGEGVGAAERATAQGEVAAIHDRWVRRHAFKEAEAEEY